MGNARGRTRITTLLSAVILLGGITPPAFQHAHADGNAPHNHHDRYEQPTADMAHGRHPHGHSHDHDHADRKPTACELVADHASSHFHVCFMWLKLQFPTGQDERSPNEFDPGGGQSSLLIRTATSEAVILARAIDGPVFLCLPSGTTLRVDRDRPCHLQGSRGRISSIPLCDTARGERSGVQLI